VDVIGKILSKEVDKITVNNISALLNKVDDTFSLKGFPLE
jgi:hypothetical protein